MTRVGRGAFRSLVPLLAATILSAFAACTPAPLSLPSGPGTPFPDYARVFDRAVNACRGVRTLTAELALAGQAGGARVRGRVLAGMARPESLRLEGVAPFGAPAFILVTRPGRATLLLPRDDRVLTDAPTAAIVEALAGIALGADDLRAILMGCPTPDPKPVAGRAYGDRWITVELEGGATAYLRSISGTLRIVASTRRSLSVEYADFVGDTPRRVRLRSARTIGSTTHVDADLTVTLAQVEMNTPLDPATFSLEVPEDAVPLTLDELRQAGPLGSRKS